MDAGDEYVDTMHPGLERCRANDSCRDEEMNLPLISTHMYGFILSRCMKAVATEQWEKTEFRFGEMWGFIFSNQIRASRRDAR